MKNMPDISKWIYEDLLELPKEETDTFEYKSSRISLDQLRNKISIAASSFWNSGGGIFIAGINDEGVIDGGIPDHHGRQSIRDWADNSIKLTEPTGLYEIVTLRSDNKNGNILEDNVVLIIKFYESNLVPHMAYDKKYYIRVGAHSDAASHFLVEALRALRNVSKPSLRGIMRYHPNKPKVEELVIVSINESTALDVQLDFNPLPLGLAKIATNNFPLEIPLINKDNPFSMEISLFGLRKEVFGDKPIELILSYKDVLSNEYTTKQEISPQRNLQPMAINENIIEKLIEAIEKLADKC